MFEPLNGYCKSPAIFIKKTGRPDPDGILSETIFGPLESFKCACGFLKSRTLDINKVCPKCGVLCAENSLRLETFGRIKTVFPFIKTNKKVKLIKLFGKNHKQLLDPVQADANLAIARYIAVKNDKSELMILTDLTTVPNNFIPIPFRITGIYSLIFVLKYIAGVMNVPFVAELFLKEYIADEIQVLPPDIRPIFRDPKNPNELRRVEVNDFYISILNSNKRNELLQPTMQSDEATWIDMINESFINKTNTQEIAESIVLEYDRITAFYQYYVDKIYEWCFSMISGKKGMIRSSILGRILEFSSRQVVCVDPNTKPYEIKMSRQSLYTLWMPYFIRYLTVDKKVMTFDETFVKIASKKYTEIINDKEIHGYFLEFLDWFCNSEEAKIIDY